MNENENDSTLPTYITAKLLKAQERGRHQCYHLDPLYVTEALKLR